MTNDVTTASGQTFNNHNLDVSVALLDDLPSWRANSVENSHVSIKVESYDGRNDHNNENEFMPDVAQNEDMRNALLNKLNAFNYNGDEKGRISRTSSADGQPAYQQKNSRQNLHFDKHKNQLQIFDYGETSSPSIRGEASNSRFNSNHGSDR